MPRKGGDKQAEDNLGKDTSRGFRAPSCSLSGNRLALTKPDLHAVVSWNLLARIASYRETISVIAPYPCAMGFGCLDYEEIGRDSPPPSMRT